MKPKHGPHVVVTCLPVDDVPDLPKIATYSKYEKVSCDCGRLMWLGERTKQGISQTGEKPICTRCLVEKYGTTDPTQIEFKNLTDDDH